MKMSEQLLLESTSRHCSIYKASDGKWYMELAPHEYGEREDATTYGPFSSFDATMRYLDNFSNPGGWNEDDSGTRPPPKLSPNGLPVEKPTPFGSGGFGGFGGFSSYARSAYGYSARDLDRKYAPKPKMSSDELKNRLSNILHDYGDEYGWDQKPSVQEMLDQLADETRKEGWSYDDATARRFAEELLGVRKSTPAQAAKPKAAPAPPAKPAAPPAAAPKTTAAPKPPRKKTYKIYGNHHDADLGTSHLHTRIGGRVFAPTADSKFKKGDSAEVTLEPDGKKVKVKKVDNDHTQTWTAKESVRDQETDTMRIKLGELKKVVREALRKADPRMDAGKIEKGLQAAPEDPEVTALKNDIRALKTRLTKFEKMDRAGKKHGQDLAAMRAYVAELEGRLAAKLGG